MAEQLWLSIEVDILLDRGMRLARANLAGERKHQLVFMIPSLSSHTHKTRKKSRTLLFSYKYNYYFLCILSQVGSNTTKTHYLSCDTECPAASSKGSNGRILQWTLIFPLSSWDKNIKLYLTQVTGEDKYTEIYQTDMNMFKKAGVYHVIALDSVESKTEPI